MCTSLVALQSPQTLNPHINACRAEKGHGRALQSFCARRKAGMSGGLSWMPQHCSLYSRHACCCSADATPLNMPDALDQPCHAMPCAVSWAFSAPTLILLCIQVVPGHDNLLLSPAAADHRQHDSPHQALSEDEHTQRAAAAGSDARGVTSAPKPQPHPAVSDASQTLHDDATSIRLPAAEGKASPSMHNGQELF